MEMEVVFERMEMEAILERKLTKLVKTWAPVLLLMGLLIAVDTFDSAAGESLVSLMQHSVAGFGTRHSHLQLPAHEILSSNKETTEKSSMISELRKGRRLLQRRTHIQFPNVDRVLRRSPDQLKKIVQRISIKCKNYVLEKFENFTIGVYNRIVWKIIL